MKQHKKWHNICLYQCRGIKRKPPTACTVWGHSSCTLFVLSLHCACRRETCSLWPTRNHTCHTKHATQHPPTTLGHDWSMPQLQWQLVMSATSGHRSPRMNPMLKRPHTCNSPDASHSTVFALINGSLLFIFLSAPRRTFRKKGLSQFESGCEEWPAHICTSAR